MTYNTQISQDSAVSQDGTSFDDFNYAAYNMVKSARNASVNVRQRVVGDVDLYRMEFNDSTLVEMVQAPYEPENFHINITFGDHIAPTYEANIAKGYVPQEKMIIDDLVIVPENVSSESLVENDKALWIREFPGKKLVTQHYSEINLEDGSVFTRSEVFYNNQKFVFSVMKPGHHSEDETLQVSVKRVFADQSGEVINFAPGKKPVITVNKPLDRKL